MPRKRTEPTPDETDPVSLVNQSPVHKDMNSHQLMSACLSVCIEDSQGEAIVIGKDALARLLDNAA